MDPFEDIFADAAAKPAPAHSKFQPRARLGPRKGPSKPKPSSVPTKEKQVAPIPLESIASVDSSLNVPRSSSSLPKELASTGEDTKFKDLGSEPENVESAANKWDSDVLPMSESIEGKSSRNMTAGIDPLGFDDENLHDLLPVPTVPGGEVGGKFRPKSKETQSSGVHALDSSASLPHVTNEVPSGDGDWNSSYVKSAEENEDVISHLESIDYLPTQSLNKEGQTPGDFHEGNEMLSAHSNSVERKGTILSSEGPITPTSVDINVEKDSGLPVQNSTDSSHFMEVEVFPGSETVECFAEITRSSRGKFVPKPKAQSGAKEPDPRTFDATFNDNDHRQDPLIDFEREHIGDGTALDSIPEEIFQFSSIRPEQSNHSEPSGFDTSIIEDVEYSELNPDNLENLSQAPNKSSMDNVDHDEGEKSSRQLRKRVAAPHLVDESDGDGQDDESFHSEPDRSINGEDEDDESREHNTLKKKKARRKSKASKCKDEKPSRKRKGAEETLEQFKEPKKKFSHTTRRSRRCVDKVLLQTPEEEIDFQKVKIRDLILLAEHKERSAKKSAKLPRKPSNDQSLEKASEGDDVHNDEGSTLPEVGNSSGKPSESTEPSVTLFNYQSFMKRTPSTRWSKQDTELFYEGIRQFGTDLSMIKELFPNLTRHQVKLKLKKEERQNPMRLFETLATRAKDHRHFELVIERLQTAAQVDKETNLDNSEADSLENDSEDSNPETNDVSEAAKPEEDREGGNGDTEGNNNELQSDLKLAENEEDRVEEDDEDFFSSYKSEF